ncbi:BPSL0067 family protein [Kosakonia sp. SMBL-WEM22]|uniref:BPSL0067 family protein n=1 Tax=Kosakonia sp. SMBL-WEM22 TaxID=2725560 RepID=UPI0016594756|nr:BPSL0067 family protein [Kosakonia sp. SMBL-WEM22]QNQ21705.1 BPSL0067 family protein [Kosakonia sp. SMBL-WEM22]
MAYIASTPSAYVGKSVGNGQCVAYTQKAANMPRTVAWKRGALVKGNTSIAPGTAIATFDANGRYGNHTDGSSHAAIYLGLDASGIQVLDQWMTYKKLPGGERVATPHYVSKRTIRFHKAPRAENNGDNYYVVE